MKLSDTLPAQVGRAVLDLGEAILRPFTSPGGSRALPAATDATIAGSSLYERILGIGTTPQQNAVVASNAGSTSPAPSPVAATADSALSFIFDDAYTMKPLGGNPFKNLTVTNLDKYEIGSVADPSIVANLQGGDVSVEQGEGTSAAMRRFPWWGWLIAVLLVLFLFRKK